MASAMESDEGGDLMDPASIGATEWSDIGQLLTRLWIVVFFIVVFATNMLLGHNAIPSLLASKDLPEIVQKTRPAFYAVAAISFGLAMYFLALVVDDAGVLRRIWADYWI